ncbi:hypothetical protein O181_103678 [Austropuccinia psidii MF-1]|uniref:Uncharacterized protein n=1 Tax=Austropuccinia psidii MF-1 TaxID=1389203 RepID=A0A9Q3JIQ8_9BASI|nr:hypothetical protein [Austropuccinia psidii MF-1]
MHLFSAAIQWHQYQMVILLSIRSSRHIIQSINKGSRASVKALIPMMPSSNHWLFSFTVFPKGILELHSQGIFKRQFQNNLSRVNAPSIHLGNHIHSIHSGFTKTCISFIQHGKIIQPSSFLNLARYTFHQTINTASSTQYRSAASLKE